MIDGAPGDLTLEEMRAVIASIFKVDAEKIEDYLIIAKQPCDSCGRQYCGDGPLMSVGSRAATLPDGTPIRDPAFDLHLIAKLTDSLAQEWADEKASHDPLG